MSHLQRYLDLQKYLETKWFKEEGHFIHNRTDNDVSKASVLAAHLDHTELILIQRIVHYQNLPMQYTEIFFSCKN